MTDMQLYLAIGIPVVVMVLGFVWSSTALRSEMNARFEGLNGSINARFDAVNARLDALSNRIDSLERRVAVIEADLRTFFSITGNHQARIENLEKR
jgi:hypothetical protein